MFRIALAQINLTVGDIAGNIKKIKKYINSAVDEHADLVAFPELAVSGYPPEDLLLINRFVKQCMESVEQLRREINKDITAVIGCPYVKNEKVYNSAVVLSGGGVKEVYFKMHLPNYGVFDEKRYFEQGDDAKLVTVAGNATGVNICEDIWIPEGPTIEQKARGAKLIINISASPFYAGKSRVREKMIIERARINKISIAFVNLVGGQDELVFDGNSLIVSGDGQICSRGASFKEELLIADIDHIGNIKQVSKHKYKQLGPVEEIVKAIITGTRDYITKNGFTKVLLGLSGGIDSSVVTAIAAEAIGRENVIAVSMPSMYSSKETIEDSRKVAANLGIRHLEIPITDVFKTYKTLLAPHFEGLTENITEENLQARIRGNLLMAMANKFNWMVMNTSNKSETSVGYSTLYGDMVGGYSPLKDVPKTKVYEIAKQLNCGAGKEIIPETVISRAPSAELRPDQKDIDSLPPYDLLDQILEKYIEKDLSLEEIIDLGYKPELVKRILTLVDMNEYKRRQAPPGVKITPRAFGKDRRFPITNRYIV